MCRRPKRAKEAGDGAEASGMLRIRSLRAIAAPGNRERLLWAVRIRWLVIAGFLSLALLARLAGGLPWLGPCGMAAGVGALLNGLNHWCVRQRRFVRTVTALAIPGDVLLITYVVIHTGGVQSPFVMMYVVQVTATAMLVDLAVAGVSAVGSVACFVAAVLGHGAGGLDAAPVLNGLAEHPVYQLIWAVFLLYCLALLAYVGGYISEQLRQSEENLAQKHDVLRQALSSLERAHADLRDTYDRLRSAEAQLLQSEKMRALGQFVAGIAHELNNPIAFVSGNVEHLRRSVEPLARMLDLYGAATIPEPVRAPLAERRRALRIDEFIEDLPSVLGDCEEGARRATEIVNALRAFSRGEQLVTWSRADIRDGLDRTLALLRHRVRDGVTVHRDYEDIPLIDCIPGQLDQVFLNLLTNAIDAVGGHGCIAVRIFRADDPPQAPRRGPHVVVAVRDGGRGIPDDLRGRVFEPFFTTKEEGKGTGLGLSVSYSIVEQHGGTITVHSSPGEGSTFTVYLPLQRTP